MASVMALGSVAVVANAEETATAVKTKADLEAYIASFEGFRTNEINDYGSISGEKFLDAIEYADNVLADGESSVDDYTVAYAMVEATYNALKIYTADELKLLIDNNKANYESGNVYNEELGDPIFKEGGFETFEGAYEDAESVLDSADSRIITDAYEALESAVNGLSRYPVVTKAQFRAALKAYETMLQKEYAYDAWRVGSMGTDWVNLSSVDDETGYWGYSGQAVSYGVLYSHVASANEYINTAYEQMDEIKSLSKTSLTDIVKGCYAAENAVAIYNAWSADDTARGSKSGVSKLLNEYHGQLVYDYNTSAAEELFQAVSDFAGGDIKIQLWINDNAQSWLDLTDADDAAEFKALGTVWNAKNAEYDVNPDFDGDPIKVEKLISASIDVKSSVQFYIPLDEDGYWTGEAMSASKPTEGDYKLVTKNVSVDLTEYIPVDSSMLTANTDNADINNILDGADDLAGWTSEAIGQWGALQGSVSRGFGDTYITSDGEEVPMRTDLAAAMALVELYVANDKDAIKDGSNPIYKLDTTDSIAEDSAKGSSAEWTIVYRYLKYALEDKYSGSVSTHTKAEVEALIDTAYEIAELTGDAAMFAYNHNLLVDARQDALDWVKAANKDKKYKDNVSAPDGKTATMVWNTLNGYVTNLTNDYNAFKYSFEEVYLAIADAKAMIDDGDLEATADLTAALENTAYCLSVVQAMSVESENYSLDNDAYTSDRYFQGFNRVFTSTDDYTLNIDEKDGEVISEKIIKPDNDAVSKTHRNLADAYEALKAAIAAQSEVAVLKGDVNGDGVVNALDAAALLKNVVDGVSMDAAVADYDANGTINALDAAAILTAIVNG